MKIPPVKTLIYILVIAGFSNIVSAQIQIDTNVTYQQIVEKILGPGILAYDNVTIQGANCATAVFSNGLETPVYMNDGVLLCTGDATLAAGPNLSYDAGKNNNLPGHPSLNGITIHTTYDAALLEFDFQVQNDSLLIWYSFGSEAYDEKVESIYSDVCGIFLSGPNPLGGIYPDKNIAIVPGTANTPVCINYVNNGWANPGNPPVGPCTNCAYYFSNLDTTAMEYDGFTTKLVAWALVVPNEIYHIKIGIADVSSYAYDSGLFLEGDHFISPGPPEFISFGFLKENNPDLPFDIEGVVYDNEIHLSVPLGTDVSNLIASWEDAGAWVFVDDNKQLNGITVNDFSSPLLYTLEGSGSKIWSVVVDVSTGVFEKTNSSVRIYSTGNDIIIRKAAGSRVTIFNSTGAKMRTIEVVNNIKKITGLKSGLYIIQVEINGNIFSQKVLVSNK
ncbi:MAG: T9SS type A sorting domain-containing protein [Bacteroidetes bacterium]|nr:T9SS type A sorting domain-containing protein [Bacteroidota bacterium]